MSPLELGPPVGLAGANSRRRSQCQRDPRCRRLDFEIAVRVISQLCPGDYPIFVRDLNAQYASIVHGGDTQNLNTTFSCLLVKAARGFSIPPNDSPSHAPGTSLESSPSRLLLIRQEFSNLLRARGEICTYQSTRSEDGKVRYEQGCRRTKASFDDADRDGPVGAAEAFGVVEAFEVFGGNVRHARALAFGTSTSRRLAIWTTRPCDYQYPRTSRSPAPFCSHSWILTTGGCPRVPAMSWLSWET